MPTDRPARDAGRRLTRRAFVTAAAGSAALLAGCVPLGGSSDPEPEPVLPWLTVVATTPVLADLVRAIGGSRVEVRSMMPPSADPRRFVPEPEAGDVFIGAKLIVQHGLGLEPGLQGLLDAGAADVPLAVATGTVPPDQLITRASGAPDPYLWHDPALIPPIVSRVLQSLRDVDGDARHQAAYDRNSEVFLNQVALADAYLTRRLALVPDDRRLLATANDTFAYLARRFGFATSALLTDDVPFPTDVDVGRFADALLARRPVAAFLDASLSPTALQDAILRAAADGPIIPIGGMLYGAGLGQGDTYQGRYLGMVRRNADRIVLALR